MRTINPHKSSLQMTQARSVPWTFPLSGAKRKNWSRNGLLRTAIILVFVGLLGSILGACSSDDGGKFEKEANAAIGAVSGVVSSDVRYQGNPGMGATIRADIEVSAGTDLMTALAQTLKSFGASSSSVQGNTTVYYVVFPEGAKSEGVTPDALGLKIRPTVAQIQEYAKHN